MKIMKIMKIMNLEFFTYYYNFFLAFLKMKKCILLQYTHPIRLPMMKRNVIHFRGTRRCRPWNLYSQHEQVVLDTSKKIASKVPRKLQFIAISSKVGMMFAKKMSKTGCLPSLDGYLVRFQLTEFF